MSTSIVPEGLDVNEIGHVLVKLSDTPSEQWTDAFREYWGKPGAASPEVKKEAFSHFSDNTIVFRGVDVDGFVRYCKGFTQEAVKFANEEIERFEAERDARIRGLGGTAGRDQKHIEAERAKAQKVRFE